MTAQEFVEVLKLQTSDAAVRGAISNLQRPPGRKPHERLVELSNWYGQLNDSDREMLRRAIKEAAEFAVFSFLCVLDGVSVIESTPDKGELELYFVKDTERTLINDPKAEELHNLYNSLCND